MKDGREYYRLTKLCSDKSLPVKIDRTFGFALTLLLVAILPLRGFGAESSNCVSGSKALSEMGYVVELEHADHDGDHRAENQSAHDDHDHDTAGTHHGTCSNCCCTASITSPHIEWHLPVGGHVRTLGPTLPAPLTVMLDGLDRPPRFYLA